MFNAIHRPALVIATVLALPFGAAACGGGDDDSSSNSEAAGISTGLDVGGLTTCLENRGFDVTREADQDEALQLPDEYKESVGLVENLVLGSIGDVKGIGSVGVYGSADEASAANEAAAGFRTDDVLADATGVASWDYIVTSGGDPGVVPMITACLT